MEAISGGPSILEVLARGASAETSDTRQDLAVAKAPSYVPASEVDSDIDAFADDAFAALVMPGLVVPGAASNTNDMPIFSQEVSQELQEEEYEQDVEGYEQDVPEYDTDRPPALSEAVSLHEALPDAHAALLDENATLRLQAEQATAKWQEMQSLLQSAQQRLSAVEQHQKTAMEDQSANLERVVSEFNLTKAALQQSRDQERQLREQLEVSLQQSRDLEGQLAVAQQQSRSFATRSDEVATIQEQLQLLQRRTEADRKLIERARRALSIGMGLLDEHSREQEPA